MDVAVLTTQFCNPQPCNDDHQAQFRVSPSKHPFCKRVHAIPFCTVSDQLLQANGSASQSNGAAAIDKDFQAPNSVNAPKALKELREQVGVIASESIITMSNLVAYSD